MAFNFNSSFASNTCNQSWVTTSDSSMMASVVANHEIDEFQARESGQKRIRLGSSPIEHQQLCALKKMERATAKQPRGHQSATGVCDSHRAMLDLPGVVVQLLQKQGHAMNLTHEAIETLVCQSQAQGEKIPKRKGTGIQKKGNASTAVQPAAVKSPVAKLDETQHDIAQLYHHVVQEMLENFKNYRPSASASSSIATRCGSGSQHLMIQKTMECVKNIWEIIFMNCDFDCNLQHASSGISFLESPPGQAYTWEQVCSTLERMDHNLVEYLEFTKPEENQKKKGTGIIKRGSASCSQMLPEDGQIVRDFDLNLRKRKIAQLPDESLSPSADRVNGFNVGGTPATSCMSMSTFNRKMITPRRATFSFLTPDTMEVDG